MYQKKFASNLFTLVVILVTIAMLDFTNVVPVEYIFDVVTEILSWLLG